MRTISLLGKSDFENNRILNIISREIINSGYSFAIIRDIDYKTIRLSKNIMSDDEIIIWGGCSDYKKIRQELSLKFDFLIFDSKNINFENAVLANSCPWKFDSDNVFFTFKNNFEIDGNEILKSIIENSQDKNTDDKIYVKDIHFNEEIIENVSGARENVAVVNLKNSYGYKIKCIKKMFLNSEIARKEAKFSKILNSSATIYPKIIEIEEKYIYREYISGQIFGNIIVEYRSNIDDECYEYLKSLVFSIIDIINYTHEKLKKNCDTQYILYDMDLNNFIISNENIYYIDLRSVKEGDIITDYKRLCAYLLHEENKCGEFNKKIVKEAIEYINNTIFYSNDLSIEDIYLELEIIYAQKMY